MGIIIYLWVYICLAYWIRDSFTEWRYRYTGGSSIGDARSKWDFLLWQGRYDWYHFAANSLMEYGWYKDPATALWFYLSEIHDGWFGHMVTGWIFWQGRWYYLAKRGEHAVYGAMLKGWQFIDGKWYYFEISENDPLRPEGSLYMNTVTPDGYLVGADGAWIQ